MFSHDQGYYVFTALIFLAIALGHILRLVMGWEITYIGYKLPNVVSIAIIFASLYMTLRGFRASKDPVTFK